MKPIFIINVPLDITEQNTLHLELIHKKLESDYHVLIYKDNRCEEMTFKMFHYNEINAIEYDKIISDLIGYINENQINLTQYNKEDIKQLILKAITNG